MENYRHRLGRFAVHSAVISRDQLDLLPLFSRVVVVACTFNYATASYDYAGLSPDFDEIPQGSECPTYEWEWTRDPRVPSRILALKAIRLTPPE